MSRIVFVQRQVSQLDEPVYARMHKMDPGSCAVIYWNDYGFVRTHVDPELGLVPALEEPHDYVYPKHWVDMRTNGRRKVFEAIRGFAPHAVVMADVPSTDRLILAAELRNLGVNVALRSDKNHLSEQSKSGLGLLLERTITHAAFDILAPVSPLTHKYYSWSHERPSIPFPYSTNEEKFAPACQTRSAGKTRIRGLLGIPEEAFVFLSAAKFSSRENPNYLIEAFKTVAKANSEVSLIAIGAGPLLKGISEACAADNLSISFPGFVPFCLLQDYFFAADAFLHFPINGPWEVSVQDALIAGLGVVVAETVGSGNVLLQGPLKNFLVSISDPRSAADRMFQLAELRSRIYEVFTPARLKAEHYTVRETASRWVSYQWQ